jgi:hypothetical protein
MSPHELIVWNRNLFFRSWESCAGIAGIGCALDQAGKLFHKTLDPSIITIKVDMLGSAHLPKSPLFINVFSWTRKPEDDDEMIRLKLGELLSKERRQIRDLQFLRVA